jgi:hypothetical protein
MGIHRFLQDSMNRLPEYSHQGKLYPCLDIVQIVEEALEKHTAWHMAWHMARRAQTAQMPQRK